MAAELLALSFDADDAAGLARFWSGLLGWDLAEKGGGAFAVAPGDGDGYRMRFLPTGPGEKSGPNRIHLDLTSTSSADQQERVERALDLGGRHIDIGQTPDDGHVVLADPEGNELCVIEPGNAFLAGCGLVGAINCDGSQQVGYFWSEVLGWPLVWDQDEETAIQSPQGGSKIAWGGPPVAPKVGRNRLHLDVAPAAGSDLEGEVERLLSLGARRLDAGEAGAPSVVLADPDDNEFCVVPRR